MGIFIKKKKSKTKKFFEGVGEVLVAVAEAHEELENDPAYQRRKRREAERKARRERERRRQAERRAAQAKRQARREKEMRRREEKRRKERASMKLRKEAVKELREVSLEADFHDELKIDSACAYLRSSVYTNDEALRKARMKRYEIDDRKVRRMVQCVIEDLRLELRYV